MRLLSNWVDAFVEATEHLPSPELFRKWSGIAAVAGAIERKVWVRSSLGDLFPNLYTVLVGPPGVGKTVATATVENLWRNITTGSSGLHVAPKSLTKASLIDSLNDAKRTKTVIGEHSIHLEFNSLLINAGELGVLLPQYDPDFMNILTDIYDGRVYEEKRRSQDRHIIIKKPQLNILAATTPSYLNSTLPEGAWDQGFLSRTFLIFSGETVLIDLFSDEEEEAEEEERYAMLRSDLRQINDLVGQLRITPEAKEVFRTWHKSGGKPAPEHPKLVHYLTRRSAHLLKLCIVASVSRGDDMLLTLPDFQQALGWLLEAEQAMPDVFRALGAKGDGQMIEEAYHFLYTVWMAKKEPIPEHRLVNFLAERVPSYNILKIIEIMERSHRMEKQIGPNGLPGWKPLGRTI